MKSWFVRPVAMRPSGPGAEADVDESIESKGLARCLETEPGRYVIGLDDFERLEDDERRRGTPPIPSTEFEAAPEDLRRYCGRVQEIDGDGNIVARVWEHPSGRAGTLALSRDTAFVPEPPRAGALLHIWMWTENAADESRERMHIRVTNRTLSTEERGRLDRLIAQLSEREEDNGG